MKLTPERLTAFCAALAETCNVGRACAAVGICRLTAYKWRKAMPDFAAAWDEALKAGLLGLEDEAHRRAFEGTEEPVYQQGTKVGTVRKYSDTLAIFLLKAHDPEKYRENSRVELGGSLELKTLSNEDLEAEIAALSAQIAHSALPEHPAMPEPEQADEGDDVSDLL